MNFDAKVEEYDNIIDGLESDNRVLEIEVDRLTELSTKLGEENDELEDKLLALKTKFDDLFSTIERAIYDANK